MLLTGHYTWIDLGYIAPKQDSYLEIPQPSQSSALHASKARSQAKSEASLTAVLPLSVPLPFGAAVQLSRHKQPATVTHNYAVSEPFLMELLDTAASSHQAQPFTPFTDSLACILSLFPHAPTSPAIAPAGDISTSSKLASKQHTEACSSHSQAAHTVVPWLLSACLFCSTLALTIKGRRHVPISSPPQASSLDTEESFHIRGKQPLITPMKDTGCSPFVPVTQSAMPPPPVPYHIASCSSKIGSYRTPRGVKPTASRALSTHTNTSGCTKWQRDRNGRLASLAVQEPDSEFTSSRARKQPNS